MNSFAFPVPMQEANESMAEMALDAIGAALAPVLQAIQEAVALEIAAIERAMDRTISTISVQVQRVLREMREQTQSTAQQALGRATTATEEVRSEITRVGQEAGPQLRQHLMRTVAHQREQSAQLRARSQVSGEGDELADMADTAAAAQQSRLAHLNELTGHPPEPPPGQQPAPGAAGVLTGTPPAPGQQPPTPAPQAGGDASMYTPPPPGGLTWTQQTQETQSQGQSQTGGNIVAQSGPREVVDVSQSVNVEVAAGGDEREERKRGKPRSDVAGAGDEATPRKDTPAACELPAWLAGGIPIPGSAQWCKMQEGIRDGLVRLGQAMADVVLSSLDHAGPLSLPGDDGWLDLEVVTNPMMSIARSTLILLQKAGVDIRGQIRQIITCWRQIVGMLSQCAPQIIVPLTIVRGVLRALRHFRVGVNLVVQGHLQVGLDVETLDRTVTYLIESACPTVIPQPAQAIAAYLRGDLDLEVYKCWLRAHGCDPEVWDAVLESQSAAASPADLILASRLIGESAEQTRGRLAARGWLRESDTRALLAGHDRPASPAESLAGNMARLDPRWGAGAVALDAGFGEYWASPAGAQDRAQGQTEMRARMAWRQSWGSVIDAAAARQALRTAGADPDLTDWPGRVAYRPMSLGDVSAHAGQDAVERDRATRAALDAGYDQADAERIADMVLHTAARMLAADRQAGTLAGLASVVRVGVSDSDGIRPELSAQGYTQEQLHRAVVLQALEGRAKGIEKARQTARAMTARAALAAYRVGMTDGQTATAQLIVAGWDAPSASAALAATDALYLAADTSRQIAALVSAFQRGMMPAVRLGAALAQAGLRPDRVQQIVNSALVAQTARHPRITAAKIAALVQEGLLTKAQAQQRLVNLNYTPADVRLLSADWTVRLARAKQKAADQNSRAARAALKTARAVQREAQASMRRQEPPSFLRRAYVLGQFTRDYVHGKLTDYGYLPTTADHYLTLWEAEREVGRSKRDQKVSEALAHDQGERP